MSWVPVHGYDERVCPAPTGEPKKFTAGSGRPAAGMTGDHRSPADAVPRRDQARFRLTRAVAVGRKRRPRSKRLAIERFGVKRFGGKRLGVKRLGVKRFGGQRPRRLLRTPLRRVGRLLDR